MDTVSKCFLPFFPFPCYASNSYFLAYKLGEANFLGGVASVKGVEGFNPEAAKKRFFEIYLDKVFEQLLVLSFVVVISNTYRNQTLKKIYMAGAVFNFKTWNLYFKLQTSCSMQSQTPG